MLIYDGSLPMMLMCTIMTKICGYHIQHVQVSVDREHSVRNILKKSFSEVLKSYLSGEVNFAVCNIIEEFDVFIFSCRFISWVSKEQYLISIGYQLILLTVLSFSWYINLDIKLYDLRKLLLLWSPTMTSELWDALVVKAVSSPFFTI